MLIENALKISCILTTLMALVCVPVSNVSGADFYVAPEGKDANPGTADQPFATLDRARLAVREAKAKIKDRDIVVKIAPGTYALEKPVIFGLEDSGEGDGRVIYQGDPGNRPVLSGGVPITGWTRLENPPGCLPEAARGKVWSAPLPDGIAHPNSLFDDNGILPRAMSRAIEPDESRQPPLRVDGGWAVPTSEQRTRLGLKPNQVSDWSYVAQMELRILPRHEFCDILPLQGFDADTHTVVTAVPCSVMLYPSKLKKLDFGHGPEEASLFLENSPEFIDLPGEWALDCKAGRILLWPREEGEPRGIVLGRLTELVRIEGEVRDREPEDRPARGIVLENLIFAHTARLTKPADHRDWALQNAWDLYDRPTHAVRLRSASSCAIRACEFRRLGGGALRMDLHSQRNQVANNWIHDIGGSGILLQGYGLGTKNVNRENVVEDNLVERIGRVEWDRLGIFVWQSGANRIAHNTVRDANYTGIGVSGEGPWEIQKRFWPEGKKHWRWDEIRAFLAQHTFAREYVGFSEKLDALGAKRPDIPPGDDGSLAVAVWYHGHFLHSRDNHVLRNRVENVARICGDANAIYIGGGAGPGNRIEENYCDESPEAIRCDDDVRGTIVVGNVIAPKANPFVLKGGNTFERNILLSGGPSRFIRISSIHPNCLFGPLHLGETILRHNLLVQEKGPVSAPFIDVSGNNRELFNKTPSIIIERNAVWAPGDPAAAKAQIAAFDQAGRPDALVFGEPQFRDPANLDFRTGEASPLRTIGIEGVDVSGNGPREGFPFAHALQTRPVTRILPVSKKMKESR